VSKGL